ncbi:hypothetical protein SAMN02745126_04650 [Enhydrobacter aerosaccus]|uniref:UrcA family protein n=1 Tax=Enhydrobacter aerosaccus TaxID=225324 RepID=A0A1T4SGX1_9HYPH|nr:hypothetical protein [Enhydrobacter aerosaccus]SKA27435.1 hypothetical protein SAMN02745126_04650 [Enhydrobacter aerosaccus]
MRSIARSFLLVCFIALLVGPSWAIDKEAASLPKSLHNAPPDIVALAGREAACRRWLTAEVTDEASDTRIEHALSHLRCDSLAMEATVLQRKYAQSDSALKALVTARSLGP